MKRSHSFFSTNIKMLAVATVLFAIVFAGAVWFYLHITATAETYTDQLQLLADTKEKEDVAERVRTVLERSTEERAALDNYFLDVVQIAQFLEEIEQYTERNNLAMDSQSLTTSNADDTGIATVRIPYELYGTRESVLDFISMMEVLPYHSRLQSVRIRVEDNGMMYSELEVVISYRTHD